TRKEISRIEWCWLRDLPVNQSKRHRGGAQSPPAVMTDGENGEKDTSSQQKRFFLIMPFIPLLLKWVSKRRGQLQRGKGRANVDQFQGGTEYRRATYNGEHPGYHYDARDRAPTNGSDSYHHHLRPASRQSQNPSLCSAPPAQVTTMSTDTANHALRHILGIHHQSVSLSPGRSDASASLAAQLTRPSSAVPSEPVRTRARNGGRSGRRTTKSKRPGDAQDLKALLGVGSFTQTTPRSPQASSPQSPPETMTTGDLLAKLHSSATKPTVTTRLSSSPQPDPAILSVGPEVGAAPADSPTKPSAPMANLLNQLTTQLTLADNTPGETPTTAAPTANVAERTPDVDGVGKSEVPNQGSTQPLLSLFQKAADNASQAVPDATREPTETSQSDKANPMQNFEFNRDLLANCFQRLKS
ncbi:hypothetical protein IWQ62_001503, partial [Dispira parvispora]